MSRFAAQISYDGTTFWGWQKQPGLKGPTIQDAFQKALQEITQEDSQVVASGRTDSGVHALGQVVHFNLENEKWEEWVLERALNFKLPLCVRVLKIQKVSSDFHAQRGALKKQYSYYFQQGPSSLPHLERFSFWIRKELNVEKMNQAVQDLIGTKDFKPFQASGGRPVKTVREILEARVTREKISFPLSDDSFYLVKLTVVGTGFLKQMVRAIAGTAWEIGEGKREIDSFQKILIAQDRGLVGVTAPGKGLWLEKVWYRDF